MKKCWFKRIDNGMKDVRQWYESFIVIPKCKTMVQANLIYDLQATFEAIKAKMERTMKL